MKPLACKAQLTNGSVIVQVFDNLFIKLVWQISDGSVCRIILSKRPISFRLAPQASPHCGCGAQRLGSLIYESVM